MARPTVIFPATEHHCPMTSIKCYLVTEAHVCEQLAQSRYMEVERLVRAGSVFKKKTFIHKRHTLTPRIVECMTLKLHFVVFI